MTDDPQKFVYVVKGWCGRGAENRIEWFVCAFGTEDAAGKRAAQAQRRATEIYQNADTNGHENQFDERMPHVRLGPKFPVPPRYGFAMLPFEGDVE